MNKNINKNFNLDLFENNINVILEAFLETFGDNNTFYFVTSYLYNCIKTKLSIEQFNKRPNNFTSKELEENNKFLEDKIENEFNFDIEDGFEDFKHFTDFTLNVFKYLKDSKPFYINVKNSLFEEEDHGLNCMQYFANRMIEVLCNDYFYRLYYLRSRDELNKTFGEIKEASSKWGCNFNLYSESMSLRDTTDAYYDEIFNIRHKYMEDIFSLNSDTILNLEDERIKEFSPDKYGKEVAVYTRKLDEFTKDSIEKLKNRFILVDLNEVDIVKKQEEINEI